MSLLKRLLGEVELTKELGLLLSIGGLYSLSIALSNTFVNVFLWKQSGRFMDLAVYNMAIVVFQPLTFCAAGWCAKKVDRVMVLRLGVGFLALFYLSVLFFGENASNHLILLGGLLGTGYGFYWLAFNVLTFEITEPHTRDFFNGLLGTLSSAGGIVGPIFAGFIISRFISDIGYMLIFGLSLALFAAAVVLSFFLKRRPAQGMYGLRSIWEERSRNRNWRIITNAHFFQGIRDGTFVFVISVFVFISTGSELALGTFGLVNSGIAFLAYYTVSRIVKPAYRKTAILAGAALLYCAIFIIYGEITYGRLLLYGCLIGIGYPLMLVPYMSMTYDVIGRGWKAAEMRIEYVVVRELYLNAGRIVSISAFIAAISFFSEARSIPVLLLIVGSGHVIASLLLRRVHIIPA